MRQYDRAIQHFLRILEVDPNAPVNHWALARAYEQKEMYAEAVAEDAKAAMIEGTRMTSEDIASDQETFRNSGWQNYLKQRHERLLKKKSEAYVSPITIAGSFTRLGLKEEALTWLERAVDERVSGTAGLRINPEFDSLRASPRFTRLLKRANLG